MVSSMTGYGQGSAICDGREVFLELKSVNHRYLDLGIRLPRQLGFLEGQIRSRLSKNFSRGHIDLYIKYSNKRTDARIITVDEDLLAHYIAAAHKAAERFTLKDNLMLTNALQLPEVTTISEAEEDHEAVSSLIVEALTIAMEELRQMRAAEGKQLHFDIAARLKSIFGITENITKRAPIVVDEYKVKLSERIEKLIGSAELDASRLAAEVALFADRASIDEEIIRLKSHIAQMEATLISDEPAGRKLEFLVQELNREFNTIGSKANDTLIANYVLEGKCEVEKIREQIQNIE